MLCACLSSGHRLVTIMHALLLPVAYNRGHLITMSQTAVPSWPDTMPAWHRDKGRALSALSASVKSLSELLPRGLSNI